VEKNALWEGEDNDHFEKKGSPKEIYHDGGKSWGYLTEEGE